MTLTIRFTNGRTATVDVDPPTDDGRLPVVVDRRCRDLCWRQDGGTVRLAFDSAGGTPLVEFWSVDGGERQRAGSDTLGPVVAVGAARAALPRAERGRRVSADDLVEAAA